MREERFGVSLHFVIKQPPTSIQQKLYFSNSDNTWVLEWIADLCVSPYQAKQKIAAERHDYELLHVDIGKKDALWEISKLNHM